MMMTWRGFLLFAVTPGLVVAFLLWAFRLIPAWGIVVGALAIPVLVLAGIGIRLVIQAVRQ